MAGIMILAAASVWPSHLSLGSEKDSTINLPHQNMIVAPPHHNKKQSCLAPRRMSKRINRALSHRLSHALQTATPAGREVRVSRHRGSIGLADGTLFVSALQNTARGTGARDERTGSAETNALCFLGLGLISIAAAVRRTTKTSQ
jgi:hypothetical protein